MKQLFSGIDQQATQDCDLSKKANKWGKSVNPWPAWKNILEYRPKRALLKLTWVTACTRSTDPHLEGTSSSSSWLPHWAGKKEVRVWCGWGDWNLWAENQRGRRSDRERTPCHKKEWNNAIRSDRDGPRNCHTEWSKSERER